MVADALETLVPVLASSAQVRPQVPLSQRDQIERRASSLQRGLQHKPYVLGPLQPSPQCGNPLQESCRHLKTLELGPDLLLPLVVRKWRPNVGCKHLS